MCSSVDLAERFLFGQSIRVEKSMPGEKSGLL